MRNAQGCVDITGRSLAYALQVIGVCRLLEKDSIGRVLSKQLLRSGTSVGANIHEAQGGQTKPDFIAKLSIAHKEALESAYWIRLLQKSGLLSGEPASALLDETEQLVRILSSILLKAKGKK